MTKLYTLFACVALSMSGLYADKKERHHCDDFSAKQSFPSLKVCKDACVGGTLHANDICADKLRVDDAFARNLCVKDLTVKCCDTHKPHKKQSSSVVVTCEKCLNNIRGVVNVKTNVLPNQFNPNGVTPAQATILAGCGYTIVPESVQLVSTDITEQYRRIGMIEAFHGAARTAVISFRVCLCKPCHDRPAVTSTVESNFAVNNPFFNVISPAVFDLSGVPNIFEGGAPFPNPTYVAVEAAEVVVNQVDDRCFNINYVVSLVSNSCSVGSSVQFAQDAISQVQLAALSTVVNPQAEGLTLNFIEQCSIRCKTCDFQQNNPDKQEENVEAEVVAQ